MITVIFPAPRMGLDALIKWSPDHVFPESGRHPSEAVQWIRDIIVNSDDVSILTFSDHIIAEVGLLIARGRLSPDLAVVRLLHPDEATTDHRFDDDGCLRDTPPGFFSP